MTIELAFIILITRPFRRYSISTKKIYLLITLVFNRNILAYLDPFKKPAVILHLYNISEDLNVINISMNPSGNQEKMDTTVPQDQAKPTVSDPPGSIPANTADDLDNSMDEDGKSAGRTMELTGVNEKLLDYDDDDNELDIHLKRTDRFNEQDAEVGGDGGRRDGKGDNSDPNDGEVPPSGPPADPPQVNISFAGYGSDQRPGSSSDNVFFTDRELEPESPVQLDISVREPDQKKLKLESIQCKPLFDGVATKKTKLTMVDQSHTQSTVKSKTISFEVRDNSKLEQKANLRVNYYGPSGRSQRPVPLSKLSLSFDGNRCLCKTRHPISCDQHLLLVLTDESLPPTLGVEGNCLNMIRFLGLSTFDDIKSSISGLFNTFSNLPPRVTVLLNFPSFLRFMDAHSAFGMLDRLSRIIDSIISPKCPSKSPDTGLLCIPILSPMSSGLPDEVKRRVPVFKEILNNLAGAADQKFSEFFSIFKAMYDEVAYLHVSPYDMSKTDPDPSTFQSSVSSFHVKNHAFRIEKDVCCSSEDFVFSYPFATPSEDSKEYPAATEVFDYLERLMDRLAKVGFKTPSISEIIAGVLRSGQIHAKDYCKLTVGWDVKASGKSKRLFIFGESIGEAVSKDIENFCDEDTSVHLIRIRPSSLASGSFLDDLELPQLTKDDYVIMLGGSSMFLTPIQNDFEVIKIVDNHVEGCVDIRPDDQVDTAVEYMVNFLNRLRSLTKRVIFVGLFPRFWKKCCRDGSHFHVNFSPADHLRLIRDLTPFLQRSRLLSDKVDVVSLQSFFGPSIFSGGWTLKDQIHVNRTATKKLALGLLDLIGRPDSAPDGLFGEKLLEDSVSFSRWHHAYLENDSSCSSVEPGRNLSKILQEADEVRSRSLSGDFRRPDRSASRSDSHNSGGNRRGGWSHGHDSSRSHQSRFSPYPGSSRGRSSDSSRGRFSDSSRGHNFSPARRDNRPGRNWSWS